MILQAVSQQVKPINKQILCVHLVNNNTSYCKAILSMLINVKDSHQQPSWHCTSTLFPLVRNSPI